MNGASLTSGPACPPRPGRTRDPVRCHGRDSPSRGDRSCRNDDPDGTMPYRRPACHNVSHRRAPCSIGTYSSQPSSPTYEIRDVRTGIPPTSIVRAVPNANPWFDTSSEVAAPSTSRARGPHSPYVVKLFRVTSWSWAEPSAGRPSSKIFRSRIPMPPPVTTRNSIVGQAHDRQVGQDAAGRVQQRRVDGASRPRRRPC